MKYLITGGAGFIGSHLCDYLLADGHEVICMDNFFTGSKRNVSHLSQNSNFEIIRHDVVDPFRAEVDAIYHLACPASPVHYRKYPINTIKCSVLGSINALDLADNLKVPILFSSTSEIYGDPLVHPQTEEYFGNTNTVGSRSCYDESKRCAETLFSDYRKHRGVETKIARIFNTYGPRLAENDGRVVSNFILQALRGDNITIYGDGLQTRSLCHVSDTASGLIKLMDSKACCGPVNIGNPSEITIRELAERIIMITNSRSSIVFRDLPEGDPKRRCPDISLAKSILGWEPMISLDDGLRNTISYFSHISKPEGW